jgi:hypothetical protein
LEVAKLAKLAVEFEVKGNHKYSRALKHSKSTTKPPRTRSLTKPSVTLASTHDLPDATIGGKYVMLR